jgi:hypothetical protein
LRGDLKRQLQPSARQLILPTLGDKNEQGRDQSRHGGDGLELCKWRRVTQIPPPSRADAVNENPDGYGQDSADKHEWPRQNARDADQQPVQTRAGAMKISVHVR